MRARFFSGLVAVALAAGGVTPRLVLTAGARRSAAALTDAPVEHVLCMTGARLEGLVLVTGLVEVPGARATATRVLYDGGCAAVAHVVGIIHNHPGAVNCWYFFPTTVVGTSDAAGAAASPYPVDAIWCGGRIVWMFNGKERS